jgi:hypothetical protein
MRPRTVVTRLDTSSTRLAVNVSEASQATRHWTGAKGWLHGLFPTHSGISRLLFMRFQNTGSHGIDRSAIHETTPPSGRVQDFFFLWHSLANRTTQWTHKVVDPFPPRTKRVAVVSSVDCLSHRVVGCETACPTSACVLCEHSVLSHQRQHYENFQRPSLTVD